MPITGTPGHGSAVSSWRRHQRPDDVVAEPLLAPEHAGHLVDVRRRTGDDHPLVERPSGPGGVQGATQQEPAQDERGDADGEEQEEEAAGELELGEVGADPDQAGGEHAGVEDPLVLVGARSEDVARVGTDQPQHQQPAAHHERSGQAEGVGDLDGRRVEDREPVAAQRGGRTGEADGQEVGDERRRCQVAQRPVRGTGDEGEAALGEQGHPTPAPSPCLLTGLPTGSQVWGYTPSSCLVAGLDQRMHRLCSPSRWASTGESSAGYRPEGIVTRPWPRDAREVGRYDGQFPGDHHARDRPRAVGVAGAAVPAGRPGRPGAALRADLTGAPDPAYAGSHEGAGHRRCRLHRFDHGQGAGGGRPRPGDPRLAADRTAGLRPRPDLLRGRHRRPGAGRPDRRGAPRPRRDHPHGRPDRGARVGRAALRVLPRQRRQVAGALRPARAARQAAGAVLQLGQPVRRQGRLRGHRGRPARRPARRTPGPSG